MKKKKLKDLAEQIAGLEWELARETDEKRRQEIEREIVFASDDSSLTLEDYFLLDVLIQEEMDKLRGK